MRKKMAKLLILTDEEYSRMWKMFGEEPVIVTKQSTLDALGIPEEMAIDMADEYNFGGEADAMVDFAGNEEHYFWTQDDPIWNLK